MHRPTNNTIIFKPIKIKTLQILLSLRTLFSVQLLCTLISNWIESTKMINVETMLPWSLYVHEGSAQVWVQGLVTTLHRPTITINEFKWLCFYFQQKINLCGVNITMHSIWTCFQINEQCYQLAMPCLNNQELNLMDQYKEMLIVCLYYSE